MGKRTMRFVGLVLMLAVAEMVVAASAEADRSTARPAGKPLIVVGGASWCPFCKQLKERLSKEAALQPLVRKYSVSYVDLENKQQAAAFVARFHLTKITLPTMVVAAPNGNVIYVANGEPQGGDLAKILKFALSPASGGPAGARTFQVSLPKQTGGGIVAHKDDKPTQSKKGSSKDRKAALQAANKLLTDGKIDQAVEIVAPFESAHKKDGLGKLILRLEKDARVVIVVARKQLADPKTAADGLAALKSARETYGKLPGLKKDFSAAFKAAKIAGDSK